jgi:hypothetical protein
MLDVAHRWSRALGPGLVAVVVAWAAVAAAQQPPPPAAEAAPPAEEIAPDPRDFEANLGDLVVEAADVRGLAWEEYRQLLRAHPDEARGLAPEMLSQIEDAPQEWACLGCHEAGINARAWKISLHRKRGFTCRHCHGEAAEVPHPDGMPTPQCEHCHDGMKAIRAGAEISAHGPQGPGSANGCAGCHDPHSMGEEGASSTELVEAGCRDCHEQNQSLVDQHSEFLCATELHLAQVGCMHCHLEGDDSGAVHNVKFGEAAKAVTCTDCHGEDSLLALAGPVEEEPGLLRIHNRKLEREKGYLIGANRLLGLDYAIILLILGACCFPVAHGGLRVLFRRSR